MQMFLSQTAEYALRAMAWIASRPTGQSLRTQDLSQGTGIPAEYLSKILRRLVLAGILESRKGRGGGFVLARPPGRIRFRDVLAAVDAYPREGRCAFGWGSCDPSRPCPLHASWSRMSEPFRDWAMVTTFAEIAAAAEAGAADEGSPAGSNAKPAARSTSRRVRRAPSGARRGS